MASIYRRTRTYPIPEGATITERRRKATPEELRGDPTRPHIIERVAKWTDGKGKQRRGLIDPSGRRVVVESGTWLIAYWQDGQRVEVNSGTPDKQAAETLAGKLETESMLRQRGIIDATAERFATEGRRPLGEQLADFKAYLGDRQNCDKHVEVTAARVAKLVEACKAQVIGDLTDAGVMAAVGKLRNDGASLQTCNHYLRAVKMFSRWLWLQKRTAADTLAGLTGFNADTDRKRVRREFSPEEVAYLLRVVESYTTPNHNMTGPERAMAYRLALGTGFRAKELRSLTPASFDLQADPPTVTVAAGYSKRRRQDVQPIRADLASLLRPWLAGRPQGERLFESMPERTARMLQDDLEEARARWLKESPSQAERRRREKTDFLRFVDGDGRRADFHALRHTYISGIVATGASVKTAQELARHSTPTLTIGRYAHTRLHDLQGALDGLPALNASSRQEAQRLTGTDGKVVTSTFLPANRQQYEGETCQNVANDGGPTGGDSSRPADRNILPMASLGENRQDLTKKAPVGVEPTHGGFAIHQPGRKKGRKAASCQQIASSSEPAPQDLQAVIDAWPDLPEPLRAGIVAMVKGVGR